MPPVRFVFFDIGDTLVFDDPPLRERFAGALLEVGEDFDPGRLPAAFREGERFALAHYLTGIPWDDPGVLRDSTAAIREALGLPPLTEAKWAELAQAFSGTAFTRRVAPGAFALLEELRRRGFPLGVISDWDETLPGLLTHLGLRPFFSALAVSSLVGATKPAPALFQDALRQIDADPATSLHVGDWEALDVSGARSAGMQALLFDHAGRSPAAECPRVETFDALRDALLALPRPGQA